MNANCDEIYRTHEKSIENCLRVIVRSVDADIDFGQQNERYKRHLFEFLRER